MCRAQVLVQELSEVRVAVPGSLNSCKKHGYVCVVRGISPACVELFSFPTNRGVSAGVRHRGGECVRRFVAADVCCGGVNECGVAIWESNKNVSPFDLCRQVSGRVSELSEAVVLIKRLTVGQNNAMRVVFVLVQEPVCDVSKAAMPDVFEAVCLSAAKSMLAAAGRS